MERWVAGAMRALAIAADGVTKRRIPGAVRGRACTTNWRAGRPCRIAPATQNNSTSGMVKPRAALPAKGGDQRGIHAMAAPGISALGMGDPEARSSRVSALGRQMSEVGGQRSAKKEKSDYEKRKRRERGAGWVRRVRQAGASSLAWSACFARRVRAHNRHCGSAHERD